MKEDESLDSYTRRLAAMLVKYSNLGRTLDNAAMVKNLFDTVSDRYINVVAEIEQFFDLQKLAFEDAVGRLKVFEEQTRRGVLVFLNANRNNPQAHGSTIVALHPEVF
jgi:hypothetical protein